MQPLATVASLGIFLSLIVIDSTGQGLRREWTRRYSLDGAKPNEGSLIALAPDGGIVVAGTSTGSAGDLDYLVIKYAANGATLWQARYDSPGLNDQLLGMSIDPLGNVIVTGSTATVKYTAAGEYLWAAPVSGRSVIANADYVYVTGFSNDDILTVQIQNDSFGSELWRRTWDGGYHQTDIGQKIGMDTAGNVYVGGQLGVHTTIDRQQRYAQFVILSYTPQGVLRWSQHGPFPWSGGSVTVNSLLVRADGIAFAHGNSGLPNTLLKVASTGALQWERYYTTVPENVGTATIADRVSGKAVIVGSGWKEISGQAHTEGLAVVGRMTEDGQYESLWISTGYEIANDIVQDSRGNFFVSGRDSYGANSKLFVVKLSNAGQQLGFDLLNEAGIGASVGNAMTIDRNNAIYVTGSASTPDGGTEFLTVKYVDAPAIVRAPNGTVTLTFPAVADHPYVIEATQTFLDWVSISTNTATPDGAVNFVDPDSASFLHRFYRGKSP